jgi:transcriptional regulator with XRE-family HTH domain
LRHVLRPALMLGGHRFLAEGAVAVEDMQPIGERLRLLRRYRGLTQVELAGLVGVSASMVSMWETGSESLDRRSTIAKLAAALRVSETDLTGGPPHLGIDPQQSGPHEGIPALRMALLTNSLSSPATDRARPAAELAGEVREIEALYRQADYVTVGRRLPAVIDELHVHAGPDAGEGVRKAALAALIEACVTASFMAKTLGYADLAHVAALRAEEAARVLGDPAGHGKAAFLRFHTAPRQMESWDRALTLAERAAGALEPHAAVGEPACILGLLTLSAALAAAVLQRGPAMEHWLSESAALAARVPDDMSANWMSFGATNVAVWRTGLAVERGEGGGKVLELAGAVDERKLTTSLRRADFLTDVGRGMVRDRQTRMQAVQWLHRAETAAPQRVRNSMPAREAVTYLLTHARAASGGRELRGMAARMGVPH